MRLGILLAVPVLALPAAAFAQDDQEQFGPVVARAGASALHADDSSSGSLCLALRSSRGISAGCSDRLTLRDPVTAEMGDAVGGATTPAVTRIEVEWADGSRTAAETVASDAYRGKHQARFFVAEKKGAKGFMVRLFDAAGTLLAAEQVGDDPPVSGAIALPRAPGISMRATLRRSLAPAFGQPDRTEVLPCIEVSSAGGRQTRCSLGEPRLRSRLDADVLMVGRFDSSRRRHALIGTLTVPGDRVELELGDGRKVRVPVRRLGEERVVAYLVPARSAARRVLLRDAAGKLVEQHVLAAGPAALTDSSGSIDSPRVPFTEPAVVAAGPVENGEGVLRVREIGSRLCAEVDIPEEGASCGELPEEPRESLLSGGVGEHRGVVGGIVPPEVAAVELTEAGGFAEPGPATVRVETQTPAGGGAYASQVRAFVGLLPVGGFVRVRMLDAHGAELFETHVSASYLVNGPLRRSRTRLRAGGLRLLGDSDCVHVHDAVAHLLLDTCSFGSVADDQVDVWVACRPAVSAVILPRKPGMTLRTARGRVLSPRKLRLGRRTHAVFVVRAPDTPRTVRWRGGRVALGAIPSPRAQCGYELQRELRRPGR